MAGDLYNTGTTASITLSNNIWYHWTADTSSTDTTWIAWNGTITGASYTTATASTSDTWAGWNG